MLKKTHNNTRFLLWCDSGQSIFTHWTYSSNNFRTNVLWHLSYQSTPCKTFHPSNNWSCKNHYCYFKSPFMPYKQFYKATEKGTELWVTPDYWVKCFSFWQTTLFTKRCVQTTRIWALLLQLFDSTVLEYLQRFIKSTLYSLTLIRLILFRVNSARQLHQVLNTEVSESID